MTSPPQQIGPYTVEREIGRGGMGVVYLARDPGLGRSVAIKAVPAEWQHDAERMGRFEREARLLASMNHPNIASVYGLQEHEGRRYLVMEFVEGRSLADLLRSDGAVPVDEALGLAAQVAGAMESAHDAGVVHRDLKPGNVIVTPEGRAKVLDFGLAKGSAAPGSSILGDPMSPTLTTPRAREMLSATGLGRVLGTVGYMSPEQARGKSVDKRTDIWALGCVLYEMLSGARAFDGETQTDAIAALLEREPDWKSLPANTPPRVRELLAKCLEKDVNRRLRDAGDARLELEKSIANREWTSSFMTSASALGLPPARGGAGRWLAAALVGLAGVAAGVGIGVVAWPRSEVAVAKPDRVCFELVPNIPKDQPEFGKPVRWARLSPDGKEVAIEFAHPTARLAVHRFDGFETRLLPGTDSVGRPEWSPDGRWVAFRMTGDRIGRVAREGGPVQILAEDAGGASGLVWTEDGRIVMGGGDSMALRWIPEDGGAASVLAEPDSKAAIAGFDSTRAAQGAPFLLSGTFYDNAIDSYNITAIDLESGSMETVMKRGAAPLPLRPDRLLFVRDSALFSVPFDFATRRVTGEERLIVHGVQTVDWGGVSLFDASANGTLIYAPGRRGVIGRRLVRVDSEGKVTPALEEPDAFVDLLDVSSDGRWAAITTLRRRMEFWVIDLQSGARTLVDGESEVYGAAFSPDGERLAFSKIRSLQDPGIMRVGVWERATGAVSEPELEDGSWHITDWTPDGGSLIAAYVARGVIYGQSDIRRVALGATPEVSALLASAGYEWGGCVSPDGQWLLYTTIEAGRGELFVCPMPPDGRRWRVSRDGSGSGLWRSANEIVWMNRRQSMSAEFSAEGDRVTISTPRVVLDHPFASAMSVPGLFPITGGGFLTIEPSEQDKSPAPVRVILNWDGGPVE